MDPEVKPNLKTKLIWKPHMPHSQPDMGQKNNPKSKTLNPKATVLGHSANTKPTDPPFVGVALNSLVSNGPRPCMAIIALLWAMLTFSTNQTCYSLGPLTQSILIWDFKKVLFYTLKSNFIYYTNSFYNTLYILIFILTYKTLK